MTTSNSIDFVQTRDQIIYDALFMIGRLGSSETPAADDVTFCANQLNKLIKHWETTLHLWLLSEGTVFCDSGVNKYLLSSTGVHACDDDTLVETSLTADASSASLTVSTTVGMTAGDTIGIELDDNTRFWTTINTVQTSTSVLLNSAVTSTASSGNTVFSYTTNLAKPMDIRSARRRIGIDQGVSDNVIEMAGRSEFMAINNKNTPGFPSRGFYVPKIDSGILYVWPTPDDCSVRIKISYGRSVQDFDTGADTPDLPQEWLLALTFNLARVVAPAFGVDLAKKDPTDILNQALSTLEELKAWDSESANIYIVPYDQL